MFNNTSLLRFLHRKIVFASVILTGILVILLLIIFKIEQTSYVVQDTPHNRTVTKDNVKLFLKVARNILEDNNQIEKTRSEPDIFDSKSGVYQETKEILNSNSETFSEIADLLKESTQRQKQQQYSKGDAWDLQVKRIKEWRPFLVPFNNSAAINDDSNRIRFSILKRKLQEWDLFDLNFPDEQSQRAMLLDFELLHSMYEDIVRLVDKFELQRTPIRNPEPEKLSLHQEYSGRSWERFQSNITQYQLYSPDDPLFKQLLEDMRTQPLEENEQIDGGSQQKLLYRMENGLSAIFKPMRTPKGQEDSPDHLLWRQYEKHFSEIAMFHLDMVLGFHRVPPVVGRYINVTSDVEEITKDLKMKFFTSPAGRRCFYGKCSYYCDTAGAPCGHPDVIEGSFMMFLPSASLAKRRSWRNPWRRIYSHLLKKSIWEVQYDYCDKVRSFPPYDKGRNLLDVMDISVFDFLTGNWDRHHYETFEQYGNFASPILFDNGRGFGKSTHDKLTILAPVYQCCLIRYSTLRKLLAFHKGPKHLSDALRESLLQDVTSPVLQEAHLLAVDRRVKMVLRTVHKCISDNGYDAVVKDDGL